MSLLPHYPLMYKFFQFFGCTPYLKFWWDAILKSFLIWFPYQFAKTIPIYIGFIIGLVNVFSILVSCFLAHRFSLSLKVVSKFSVILIVHPAHTQSDCP